MRISGALLFLCLSAPSIVRAGGAGRLSPELWLTDPGAGVLFRKRDLPAAATSAGSPVIAVDRRKTYQTVDGFGYALTGGSALALDSLPRAEGDAVLRELFSPDGEGIGTSYLRVSIGSSDLDPAAFSYDDVPPGQKDPDLKNFSLRPDEKHLIPILKRILAVNPKIKILASPWSPPPWMKSRPSFIAGSLPEDSQPVYARYLVRYLQAMKAEGVVVDALTVQNEPLNPDNEPSMIMTPARQRDFIRDHLGPALAAAGLKTKILLYDHNCDEPGYPLSILADEKARAFVDGTAFHLYAGDVAALTQVHDAYPDKNVYLTEQWTGAPGDMAGDFRWHVANMIIGVMRNWGKASVEWNLASDPEYKPHTPGGCDKCLGALTIGGGKIARNPSYYVVAQAAKFVRPGSVRVDSSAPDGLPNAAFTTPDGRSVLIVLNDGDKARGFRVDDGTGTFTASLNPGAAGTFVW